MIFAATVVLAGILVGGPASSSAPAAESGPLDVLSRVERQGADNGAASDAWRRLSQAGPEQLPQLLAALDTATPLGANWIRAAIDTIAERTLARGEKLPLDKLEAFVKDTTHAPRARRLAFEWISRADKGAPDRLIPGMLDDPSVELRRDAVGRLLIQAAKQLEAKQTDAATDTYRQAVTAARDPDQVKAAADALKQLGQPVDLAKHYGFVRHWHVIGPFDNSGKKGFDVAYPPETEPGKAIDPAAVYEGKLGPVRWLDHTTTDELGQVDLNALLGKHKGAIGYAVAELISPAGRAVEFRMGSGNANKIWLNGELLYKAEVYHANVKMDQYVARGRLKAGRNILLLKICQNEQTEDWAADWRFQLRACDATGGAVPLEN
jgi:hypothetical protein